MENHAGELSARSGHFGIVVSRFNSIITERLLDGAIDCLTRHGAKSEQIEVVRVPGSWEIPLAVSWLTDSKKFDAIIALGCVIRGGTPHFEYVASEVSKGTASAQMSAKIPVSFGVLTTDSIEQAVSRAGSKQGNKGWEAAEAAIEMASLKARLFPR